MHTRARTMRVAALALVIAAVLAACGSEGSSTNTGSGGSNGTTAGTTAGGSSGSAPAGDTIASTFVLGGPPECPERPFCQQGLEDIYGLAFKDFKALDAG